MLSEATAANVRPGVPCSRPSPGATGGLRWEILGKGADPGYSRARHSCLSPAVINNCARPGST